MTLLTHADWLKLPLCFAVGLLATLGAIPLILRLSDRFKLSRGPEPHHAHATPSVSRLGGLAFALSLVTVAVAICFIDTLSGASSEALSVIVLGSLAMFAVGFWDDLRQLDAEFKLAAQIAVAACVYIAGIQIDVLKNPFNGVEVPLGLFGMGVTIVWLVTFTNLINLIDGMDGLAGGIGLMLMCLLANLGVSGDPGFSMLMPIGVAGALLGFLRYNYSPAKIYMGDGGAYLIGFLIGALSIVNSNKGTVVAALIAPAFALAVPIVDACLAILRRSLRGLPVFRPDRKHIHHCLVTLGFSRERTVLILYTVSFLCLALALAVFWSEGRLLPLLTGLLFLVLVIAGHVSGFATGWHSLTDSLARSLALRKETRYALLLAQWLEMEVERYSSVDELWEDYKFIVRKLGFSAVTLVLPDDTHTWEADDFIAGAEDQHHTCHELNDGSIIEFSADHETLAESSFQLLADLGAETWHKAAVRWSVLNQKPLRFVSAHPEPAFSPRKIIRFSTSVGG